MERVSGIEPPSSAWKAVALPLSYTREPERNIWKANNPLASFCQSDIVFRTIYLVLMFAPRGLK
jgi:hypothetical protein